MGLDMPPVATLRLDRFTGMSPRSSSYNERCLSSVLAALQPIRAQLDDLTINEIQINGPNDVFVRVGGIDHHLEVALSAANIQTAINVVAAMNNKEVGNTKEQYVLSARLPGMRIEALLPPVAINGPSMCIRRHASRVVTLEEYVQGEVITQRQANLLRRIVEANQNFLVIGGTYSGKTTLVNALMKIIPDEQRLFIIEQVHELRVEASNHVILECDPDQGVTAQRAVMAGMRYSPHRIILGELRGSEAIDFLNACNTGHPGSCTTIHADSARDGLARLEDLILQADRLPYEAIQNRIANSIQWLMHISMVGGKRKVGQIIRVRGFDRNEKKYLFEDFSQGVDEDGEI